MRIKIVYETLDGKDIILPCHYNYAIQGLIYQTFSPEIAKWLHDVGFLLGKRKFKLFTFSRILEKGKIIVKDNDNKYLNFGRKITFYFSSPIDDIVGNLGERSFREREFSIGKNKVYISQLEILLPPKIEEKVYIKMLSPLTIYSTFLKNGSRIVHFYRPYENEFSKLIEENAKKKLKIVHQNSYDGGSLSIKPYKFSLEKNRKVVIFKNTPIEGWTGVFELSGDPALIAITYEAGLGNKNSEGFGMWEIWREKEESKDAD
ncbi:CRISPR-associated endoribonuclease Cas6 [Dictyoglomus thermophilum]|uniref:CRISPR-associated endoribonuclease n=1 Tax=Dictyoglomus thermophilum (strain ATCC 35947 / DSM 3960 / H-6-12) TaxID=309799 RepID=B5YBH5_DICT6|nr:CRISPR-associated endoribonuclease Cas6 [Dictyoglomus thermophilum]ACI18721.1 CRISPR-associated protein Cas6 [Dictyoglomus thermophilum H-6-12]